MPIIDPKKKKKYNNKYMGKPGSQRRRDYLDKVKARRGEPGSPEREKYNEYMRDLRKGSIVSKEGK